MDFTPLFKPRAAAVVGVSQTNDRHPANVIFNKNRLRYPVTVYPVNPKGGTLQGGRVYQRVSDIPEKLDLAVVAVRAEHVGSVIEDCIRAGVGGAVVVSGGFAERGRQDLQDGLAELAEKNGFPIIGPNCLGFFAPSVMDTFFIPSERMTRPYDGNVALVSQSGGILVDQVVKFTEQGVGLSIGVSIGNKAVIREMDLLRYLARDSRTEVIAFYVEGFGRGEGREFVQAAAECGKPVIVLKAGKSSAGMRAVSSHTASLAGDYKVFSSILAQHGIVEASNEFELVSYCESLSRYPEKAGRRVGIVTGSGGHGATAVDFITSNGMSVPSFPHEDQERIRQSLSSSVRSIASVDNPVDLTGSAMDDDFVTATGVLSQVEGVDCIIILLLPYSPGITSDIGARLSEISRREGKPVVAYVPHIEKYSMIIEGFELNQVPVSPSVQGAVLMLKALGWGGSDAG
jgi:acetyltransferase